MNSDIQSLPSSFIVFQSSIYTALQSCPACRADKPEPIPRADTSERRKKRREEAEEVEVVVVEEDRVVGVVAEEQGPTVILCISIFLEAVGNGLSLVQNNPFEHPPSPSRGWSPPPSQPLPPLCSFVASYCTFSSSIASLPTHAISSFSSGCGATPAFTTVSASYCCLATATVVPPPVLPTPSPPVVVPSPPPPSPPPPSPPPPSPPHPLRHRRPLIPSPAAAFSTIALPTTTRFRFTAAFTTATTLGSLSTTTSNISMAITSC
ncbi:hypothetical protein CK203_046159 [Vitis vinifera]|uniref:Uncharacterized protein n=1 Tax=Vitis vinifera TaxID=29760 RepID=A0A438I4D3_VITVI|nr:hypothetical protein CK203_046159 [Vitis vinifera]